MFNRHRRGLALVIGATCLVLVSGAGAAETDTFTATSSPTYTRPNDDTGYTINITNTSPSTEASRAKIGIPTGFTVDADTVKATTTGAGDCEESTWIPDGTLVSGGKINVKRPSGSDNNLCPTGVLKVVFSATASANGSFVWAPELADGEIAFTLSGPPPPVVVDGDPPAVTIGEKPGSLTNSRSATFTFAADEPATFACRLDNGGFVSCSSPITYNGLQDGGHTFRVRGTDAAGNATVATYSWTIDATPPAVAITTKPAIQSNSSSASFGFTVNEPATAICNVDGAAFAACSSPAAYSNLPDGPHTFTVRAIDSAGNVGEANYTWTSETRAPTAAVSAGPAALSNSRSAAFTFGADEPSSFHCQLDGGSLAACTSPASYENLGDGAHTFVVRPTDAVGNVGTVASYTWTIDATAPETTLGSAPPSRTKVLSATFSFTATEQGSFQCKLDGSAFGPCTSPKSYSGLRRTAHTFEVRSIDRAGNADATPAVHRWTITALPRTVKRTSALFAPRAGARVTAPPLLAWRRVPRASYYNVQLYRGRVKILSTWPTRTRIQLRSRWTYLGKRQKLSPGVYRWYVWPGYGRARAHRYGAMLGQSRFTVIAPKTR